MQRKDFDKLDIKEKRQFIARDVIARLDAGLMKPITGNFILGFQKNYLSGPELQRHFQSQACSVCAKGAIVTSWIARFDGYNGGVLAAMDEEVDSRFAQEVVEIFGREMLDNIEAAYEQDSFGWHYDSDETAMFEMKYDFDYTCDERIRMIFTEIAETGKFKA